jgi:hypothetical protein
MPTLLESCNEVLLQVGEREVSGFTSSVGKKVRLAYRRAQNFVGVLHAWRHLRVTVTTTNWVGGLATLPPFQSVYQAFFTQGTTAYNLTPLNPTALNYRLEQAPQTGIPRYYCIEGEGNVRLYPTPTPAMLPFIDFYLLLRPPVASNPADVLSGPDSYVELCTLYAQVIMHRTHTTDLNASQATMREFETSVHMYRTRDNLQEVSFMG